METPDFQKLRETGMSEAAPLVELMRAHKGNIVLAFGARLAETISSNIINAFGIAYLVSQLALDRSVGLNAMMVASLIGIPICPVFGALSDRFGRRAIYLAGAGFMAAFSYPFFLLLGTKSVGVIWLAFIIAYNLGPTMMFAVEATFFSELFGAGTRYTGLSLAYQVSAIVGGFMPLIGTWFIKLDAGKPWLIAGFLTAISAASFLCAAAARRIVPKPDHEPVVAASAFKAVRSG